MFTPSKTVKNMAFIFGAITLSLGLGYAVLAVWQEPLLTPPDGNIDAPLNAGPDGQEKVGGLILGTNCVGPCKNGLIVDKGNVGIGTTNPSTGKLVVSGGNIDMTNNKITNVQTPTNNLDAVNKAYVDALGGGGGGNGPYNYNYLYFYLSNNEYDGNLGGLAGADAKCAADKPSTVPNGLAYKAYLCDDTTCQKPNVKPYTILIGTSDKSRVSLSKYLVVNAIPSPDNLNTYYTHVTAASPTTLGTISVKSGVWNQLEYGISGIISSYDGIGAFGVRNRSGTLDYMWTGAKKFTYESGNTDFTIGGKTCKNWTDNSAVEKGTDSDSTAIFNDPEWIAIDWIGKGGALSGCNSKRILLCWAE